MGLTLLPFVLLLLSSFLSYGHSQERPSAVLSLEPNSSQMFTGESVILICDMREGQKTDWDYKLDKDAGPLFSYPFNIFILHLVPAYSGEYQCAGSLINNPQVIKQSNKVTLIVSDHKPKATLKADQTDLPVGGSVTLSCSVDGSSGWKWQYTYTQYHYTPSVIEQDGVHQFDGSISVSEGGVYRCIGIRGKPDYYTERSNEVTIVPQPSVTRSTQPSVTRSTQPSVSGSTPPLVTGSAKPSVPGPVKQISPLVVGLIVGFLVVILLTILLLLLCRYRTSKDPCCVRPVQSQVNHQGSAGIQGTNQSGAPDDVYCPLQHGDTNVYGVINHSEDYENDPCYVTPVQSQGINQGSAGDQGTNQSGALDDLYCPLQHGDTSVYGVIDHSDDYENDTVV